MKAMKMMQSFDVIALGEVYIEFVPSAKSPSGNELFERRVGGAPADILAAVTRLGGRCAYIGKTGDDIFGNFIKNSLEICGINTDCFTFGDDTGTPLVFISNDENGGQSRYFYRNQNDHLLSPEDGDTALIEHTKILHFDSLALTGETAKSAAVKALKFAKKTGKIISYAPNYSPEFWKSETNAIEDIKFGLTYADVLIISENEFSIIFGNDSFEENTEKLIDSGIKALFLYGGNKGCYFRCKSGAGTSEAYRSRIVDTTGCNEAFTGAVLYKIYMLGAQPDELTETQMTQIADFANAAGAVCATRRGTLTAMPAINEIDGCMSGLKRFKSGFTVTA